MLPQYELTLTLGRSIDYQRSVLILHAMALWELAQSSWPSMFSYPLAVALLGCAAWTIRQGRPHPECKQLVFHNQHWFIYDVTGEAHRYAQARVRYHAGLFFCMELIRGGFKRRVFIFYDQLTHAERRSVYLLDLNRKSHARSL